jgi:hypothetical protein
MGVLMDLVVAPLSEASAVAERSSRDRPWPWRDVKGIGLDDLATLHCFLDACDPNAPVDPPQWLENPFTKKKVEVTMFGRYVERFTVVAEEGEGVLFAAPAELVTALAGLDAARADDLARRWSDAKSSERLGDGSALQAFPVSTAVAYLNDVIAMAREASRRKEALLVWICP